VVFGFSLAEFEHVAEDGDSPLGRHEGQSSSAAARALGFEL